MTETIGFIGLGRMGLPIAQNLLNAGYTLRVFNRTAARAETLLEQGADWDDSPRAVAEQTAIVISMVADDAALGAVCLGNNGILAGLGDDGIHVDMSTIYPDTAAELAQQYRAHNAHFVAAPVFGRPDMAAAAKLWVCPAGNATAIGRCQPLFEVMSQGVIKVGDKPQQASALKLVGNFFIASAIETLSEAFTLAEKTGLARSQVLELVHALLPVPIFEGYANRIANDEFEPAGFSVPLGLKDVGLMRKLAEQVQSPLPLADLIHQHLLATQACGREQMDWAALVTIVREMAGLEPGT